MQDDGANVGHSGLICFLRCLRVVTRQPGVNTRASFSFLKLILCLGMPGCHPLKPFLAYGSFLEGNENDGLGSDDVSRTAIPKPKRSDSAESPLGSPRSELATTAPASSCSRLALVSTTHGDAHGAASGLEGDDLGGGRVVEEMPSSIRGASPEALPADIDVSWRRGQYDDDGGAVASAKRFSSTVRLRSPGTSNDAKRASSRASPPFHAIPSCAAAGSPTTPGSPGRSSPGEALLERKKDDARVENPAATSAHLFAPTFSTLEERDQDSRRSPAVALDGGASRAGGRSPMSTRVGVLQNLLAPAGTGEQDLTRPNVGIVASTAPKRSASDETNVARTLAKRAPEEKGGVSGSSVAQHDDIVHDAERLLGRGSENGSPNTSAAGRFVDANARNERTHPGLSNERSDHQQQAEVTERPRTHETKGDDLRQTRTRPRSGSGADAGATALNRGPERKAHPLAPTDEFEATERKNFDDFKGLSRPSSFSASRNEGRWNEQKAGPRPAIAERSDELEELEVRRAMLPHHTGL